MKANDFLSDWDATDYSAMEETKDLRELFERLVEYAKGLESSQAPSQPQEGGDPDRFRTAFDSGYTRGHEDCTDGIPYSTPGSLRAWYEYLGAPPHAGGAV